MTSYLLSEAVWREAYAKTYVEFVSYNEYSRAIILVRLFYEIYFIHLLAFGRC